MPILIQQAKTSTDLDQILRLRVQGERYIDHLDVFPDTMHIFALSSGRLVGAIRAVKYDANESTLNRVYNFHESQIGLAKSSVILDLLTLSANFDRPDLVFLGLMKGAIHALQLREIAGAFFCCPQRLSSLALNLGFLPVTEAFYSPVVKDHVLPCILDLAKSEEKLLAAVVDKEILACRDIFNLIVHQAGEILVHQGRRGVSAFLIEEGQVDVVLRKGDDLVSVAEMGPGQLIGELAMLTREHRTASMIAQTSVTAFTIDRADFLRLLHKEPLRSLDLFKICSKRLETANRKLAESGR